MREQVRPPAEPEAPGTATGPRPGGGVELSGAGLGRLDPLARARAVMVLQRAGGNAAIARLALQRRPTTTFLPDEAEPAFGFGDQAEELQSKTSNDSPATAAARTALESANTITLRDGDVAWSRFDVIDLGSALLRVVPAERRFLDNTVFQRFSTEAEKTRVLGGSSAAASAQTFVNGTNKTIAIWSIAFDHPRQEGNARFTGKTVHGVSQGVYAIAHEIGHLIEIPSPQMIAGYTPVEKADRTAKGDVSTQPQAKNADVRERFAEAYARFKVNADDLKTEHPGIHAFFAAGRHLIGK